MADYITTHVDAWSLLDRKVYKEPNLACFAELIVIVEDQVNGSLRRRFTVPFDSSDNAEVFRHVKEICTRFVAARYIRWSNQAEGTEDQSWYAVQLETEAQNVLDLLLSRAEPSDAQDAADPLIFIPYDNLDSDDREPWFTRAQVAPGNVSHF